MGQLTGEGRMSSGSACRWMTAQCDRLIAARASDTESVSDSNSFKLSQLEQEILILKSVQSSK